MMSNKSTAKKILLPVLIIGVALAIAALLIISKKTPPKEAKMQLGALVKVLKVKPQDYPLTVRASGTVEARQEINLEPQVSGKVVALGKSFASGVFFNKGALLIQIEQTDYRLNVEQAEAALARAEVELATTESQAAIARIEWDRLGLQQQGEDANPLTLYEPQMKHAKANIASARAALDQARLSLQRTTIVAPFDARIRSEQVDVGQFVRSGSRLATLTGSRSVEVIVSVPMEDLPWLSIPSQRRTAGSKATISLRYGKNETLWPGLIDRALGEVDPRGRMLQVAVRVMDPYRLLEQNARPPYLEVGMFVDVEFVGPVLEEMIVLPRRALRDNRTVWIADNDGVLQIRPVEVTRLAREQVVISSGLEAGERVVLTTLTGAADGMKLRVAGEGTTQ